MNLEPAARDGRTLEPPQEPPDEWMAAGNEAGDTPARRRRRRRARAKPAEGEAPEAAPAAEAEAPEPPAAEAAEAPQAEAKKPARRRRKRAEKPEPEAAPEPAHAAAPQTARPAPPARSDLSPLEALVARQNVIMDTLLAQQNEMFRSLQRSLAALERSAGGGANGTGATALPRVGIFVDVPNIMYAAERMGVTIDFGKLLEFLTRGRHLVRATAYAPISDDPQARLETQRFVQPFVNHGYRIVTKPLKRFADGSIKANFDVELAMDVLTMSDRLDVVSLVSGDGDFRRLVELVASKGVRVEVVAFGQSTASELRAVCDSYVDIAANLKEFRSR